MNYVPRLRFAFYVQLSALGVLSLLLAMLCIAPLAGAQSTGGRIRGTVTDTSGAAISGANLALTDEATNVTRSTVSGSNGEYIFLEIPVGTYESTVTQQGFKRYERKGRSYRFEPGRQPGHRADRSAALRKPWK